MKTAISIPDEVFNKAEEVAQNLGISIDELYTQAISDFIKSHLSNGVTDKLNQIYSQQDSYLDPIIAKMQFQSIEKEEW